MAWIEFNGVRSSDLGVIIEAMPSASRAQRRTTVVEPYGRHGSITIDDGSYAELSSSITINCFNRVSPRQIFSWLKGSGWLTTSDDPSKRVWVHFHDAQTAKRYRNGNIFDVITIPISLDPFCYNITETLIDIGSGKTFDGMGDYDSDPILYVSGTGNGVININDNIVYVDNMIAGQTLKIDAEAKFYTLIDADGNVSNPLLSGVSVELEPTHEGDSRWFSLRFDALNEITVEGLSCSIDPNWRWYIG